MALVCTLVATLALGGNATADPSGGDDGFDFRRGNAALEIVVPTAQEKIRESLSPHGMDVPLVLRHVALMETAWFDAVAPYHPTAVGIYSDLGRRPARETRDNTRLNTAMLHASYHTLRWLMPDHEDDWREMLTSVGLDPDAGSTDLSTPEGIGIAAAEGVVEGRAHDGMNQLGDEGGREYHRAPYADYTGYQPVNSAYEITDPGRWQPDLVPQDNGLFRVQSFITPQFGRTQAYSFDDVGQFRAEPPVDSDPADEEAYRAQADEVLEASAGLTDRDKMMAEFFDDKMLFLGGSFTIEAADALSAGRADPVDELFAFVHLATGLHIAAFDGAIAVWDSKLAYDAPRPFTAIRHLYEGEEVSAWGGPGRGTVHDMPGEHWDSYIPVGDHPEYPSGSAGICAAVAAAGEPLTGSSDPMMSFTFPAGSSWIEPGVTPAADTTLAWDTWDAFVSDCGESRILAGVHFRPSMQAAWTIGEQVGALAFDFVDGHIQGEPTRTLR
ncbi:hypothetical protein D7319_06420 [Streptomyces radicis]|uniref:Vanadium-dependent haloperoxidase n=1 Tax=Streptomyces radicis TaxID=1750517 RepID=A0A3A9WEU2_9ACTN|nr:hypothetical protein D7319_06420 [Streptomyces radicis]RKN26424.1 hypothetical protein D7318_03240 [Streptomyces radicis]